MVDEPNADEATSSETVAADALRPRFDVIGPYRLVRPVGAGGMGEVWLAEQTRPVKRLVAIKIIKAGMDTAQVVARFDAERQALAVMSHPAIAQVFDAGATPEGRPYFAMEYVAGEAITSYCTRLKLSTRERIDLFMQVCQGVHHAHQKGIIHRDLKPSNILVMVRDDKPVAKIIDFGLAKATTHSLIDQPLVTEFGALVGTPEYMSPEQAERTPLDIDTRTDVYALGVILYELLTGVLPFNAKRLRERGVEELRRTIRETDPPRPSSRITTLAGEARTADTHGVNASELARQLRGDLDCITLRALEKDRARRYGSVSDLAADLQRHLQNLPVLASPPSTVYRVGKFARRHRVGVAIAAVFVALLVTFATTAAVQARRISRERDRANREAEIARAVNDFLQNDLLAQAGASAQAAPDTKPDPDLRVRTALDRAAARVEHRFEAQPMVEASIRTTIGKTYEDLGLFEQAEPHLARAVELRRREPGDEDAGQLASANDLADLYTKRAKYDQAIPLLTASLEASRRVLGEDSPQTLKLMAGLAQIYMLQGKHVEAEPLQLKVLEVRQRVLGEQHRDTLEATGALASLYWRQGKYAQAETVRARVVDLQRRVLGEEHPATLTSLNNLALLNSYQGKYADAERLFMQVLDSMHRVLGADHLETMISEGNLGIVYYRQGRYADAEAVFERVLEKKKRVLGDGHPETLTSMNNLGVLYRAQGKYQAAERMYAQVMNVQQRVLGKDHQNVLLTMNGLALLYVMQGRNAEAEQLYKRVMTDQQRVLGAEHPDTLGTMANLVALYASDGRDREAEPLAAKVMDVRQRVLGARHPETIRSISSMGLIQLNVGRFDQAETLLRTALQGFSDIAKDGWERDNCQSMLGGSLAGQRRYEEAEPLVTAAYHSLAQKKASIPPNNATVLKQARDRVIQLYLEWGKPGSAAALIKKVEGR